MKEKFSPIVNTSLKHKDKDGNIIQIRKYIDDSDGTRRYAKIIENEEALKERDKGGASNK